MTLGTRAAAAVSIADHAELPPSCPTFRAVLLAIEAYTEQGACALQVYTEGRSPAAGQPPAIALRSERGRWDLNRDTGALWRESALTHSC
jgi:hypothetical protein